MLSVNIPLVPMWNLTSGCASTPDDGFLYIGVKTINYISKVIENQAPIVKVFNTRQRVKSLDCDPDWSETKYFSLLADDNSIQIWDLNDDKALFGHKAHIKPIHGDGNGPPMERVQLCFLRNRNVLSIDSTALVRYCVASNTYCKTKRIIPNKFEVSIMKGSPYDVNIFAVGCSRGLILVGNLKSEEVIYTLRGHDAEITSLSWMSLAPFASNPPQAPVKESPRPKLQPKKSIRPAATDDIFDIYDYDYLENEFGAPTKPTIVGSDDDQYVGIEKPKDEGANVNFNFVEACESLREDMTALTNDDDAATNASGQVTLKDCQETEKVHGNSSISCDSNNSLELVNRSTDESETEDHQVLHKADVHRQEEGSIDRTPKEEKNPLLGSEMVLLASGSQEGVVWIWNTNTGGSMDKLPLRTNHGSTNNAQINLEWINSSTLLTNNKSGELILWTLLPANGAKKITFKEEKRTFAHHGVMTFCKLRNFETIWSISYNREIICENLKEGKILAKYSCVSTNIAAIRERRDDMNKLAFACADRRIGIMNISNISATNVLIENYSNKIDSSVMALVWSPDDQFLAFGTVEGRVGIIDTEKPNNAFVMNPFCGKPIYSMEWKDKHIYACCNERIAVYDGNRKNREPTILDKITGASAISVKDDLLFVGTQTGYIQLYKNGSQSQFDYALLKEIYIGPKYISEINWSPIQPTRFAVSSMTNQIAVLKLQNDDGMEIERVLSMGDHTSGNSCVKWSNRNESMLLSCGFDGAVRVWDLKQTKNELIFLKQYHCPMLCGLFSPIDDNVILCAGKATSIEMFDIRVDKTDEFTKSHWKKNKDKAFGGIRWATKMVNAADAGNSKERRKNRKRGRGGVAGHAAIVDEAMAVTEMIRDLVIEKEEVKESEDVSVGFLKNHSTIMHLTTKESNKDTLENLRLILEDNSETDKKILSVKLFGTRGDVEALLNEELRNHQISTTNSIANVLIPQMNGDLKNEILKCVQNKKLTEWHVSLSPTISYDFWKKCCSAYANQLLEQGYILQAVTYLMALHEIREIIKNLLEKNYFKEAWIFGKIYLEQDDPVLTGILEKWIAFLDLNGHIEGAAFVCALSGQLKKCRDILSKRRRPTDEHTAILNLIDKKLTS